MLCFMLVMKLLLDGCSGWGWLRFCGLKRFRLLFRVSWFFGVVSLVRSVVFEMFLG